MKYDDSVAMSPVKSKSQKEKRGIYNVQKNNKNSTNIYKDDEFAESIIKYERGYENPVSKKGYGAKHIEKHIGKDKNGWVTNEELLNIGNAIRNTDPFLGKGKRVYEYFNNDGVRFRVIIGESKGVEKTISFYSNRKAGIGNDSLTYNYTNSSNDIIPQSSEKLKLGANAGHNMAAGFGMGTANAGNEVYENGYNQDRVLEKFMQGMAAGMIGAQGIKMFAKSNPKAFQKLRQYVVDNDIRPGTKLGAFGGNSPSGNIQPNRLSV